MSSRNGEVGVRVVACPGQHDLGFDDVASIQRARILAAMVVEVAERGVGKVTVAHVVDRSGVSRRTFYELFTDREDCFLAAFDEGIARVASAVAPAYEQASEWSEGIREGLISLLGLLDEEPALARLLIVESLAAGPRALGRRAAVLARLNTVVDEGRGDADAPAPEQVDPVSASVTAEGAVGAVLAVLHGRLVEDSGESLLGLVGSLTSMIVLPYLGPAVARRELERPAPQVETKAPREAVGNPLHELDMRLTYRTMRVLMAVAADPGSSNRVVSEGAGISDQGQVSKLLARLQRAGLVENAESVAEHGAPNAWTLTERGWEVHGAIAPPTSHA